MLRKRRRPVTPKRSGIGLDAAGEFCDTPPPKDLRFFRKFWERTIKMSHRFFSRDRRFFLTLTTPAVAAALFFATPGCKHVETADEVSSKAKAQEAAKVEKEATATPKHENVPGENFLMSDEAQTISRHLDR
jgi:hypothetical protein